MSQQTTITLTTIGPNNSSTFDIYSDVDNYTLPFETNISSSSLLLGYNTTNVPEGTSKVKLKSTSGSCDFEPVLGITIQSITQPTHTPTPTPSPTPTPLPPTNTPTPTSTPTPTPTATPLPLLTGYTNGFTILVNDRFDSYNGTGTTWTSLATGTTYNCSLLNGPVWSGGTPGFWTFDGLNDEGNFGATSSGATTNSCTFGAWFRTTTSASQRMIAMRGRDGSGAGWSLMISKESNNKMAVQVAATSPGLSSVLVESTTTLVSNTWYNVYGVWNEGTNCKIYVNGVLQNTVSFDRTSLRTSGIGWNLARGNFSYTNCNVSEFITYNNILSDAEVLFNFNNTKSKYGY